MRFLRPRVTATAAQRGALDLLLAMLPAGNHVVDTFTAAVDTLEAIRGICNFILLTICQHSGNIERPRLYRHRGRREEKAYPAPGILRLLN